MQKKEKLCLGIDTTSNAICVACLSEHGQNACINKQISQGQGELLLPFIQEVLDKMNKKPSDLTHIAVTVGPGSFTGIRIGLATARGLGLALKIPVLGVDNFLATSHNQTISHKVVLDTKRGDYFVQDFNKKGQFQNKPTIQTAQQLKSLLPFAACGSGAQKLATEIGCDVIADFDPPLALAAAEIALKDPKQTCEPHPLYLREADVTI